MYVRVFQQLSGRKPLSVLSEVTGHTIARDVTLEERVEAGPTPANHAISAQLKAGETVYQAGELPKTLGISKILYEPPRTVCKTPFASMFLLAMEHGDGTR